MSFSLDTERGGVSLMPKVFTGRTRQPGREKAEPGERERKTTHGFVLSLLYVALKAQHPS